MLCLREGYRSGLYGKDTYHILAERDPLVQHSISRRLHTLGSAWEPCFHRDELHKLNLRQALLGSTLDWAYLDLCAALNTRTAWWIRRELGPNLSRGAALAITLSRNWRTSKLMAVATDMLRETLAGKMLIGQMHDDVRHAETVGNTACLNAFTDGRQEGRYHKGDGSVWCYDRQASQLSPVFHESSLEALATVRLLLPDYSFRVDTLIEYQRNPDQPSHNMTAIRLVDIQPQRPSLAVQHLAWELENIMEPCRLEAAA